MSVRRTASQHQMSPYAPKMMVYPSQRRSSIPSNGTTTTTNLWSRMVDTTTAVVFQENQTTNHGMDPTIEDMARDGRSRSCGRKLSTAGTTSMIRRETKHRLRYQRRGSKTASMLYDDCWGVIQYHHACTNAGTDNNVHQAVDVVSNGRLNNNVGGDGVVPISSSSVGQDDLPPTTMMGNTPSPSDIITTTTRPIHHAPRDDDDDIDDDSNGDDEEDMVRHDGSAGIPSSSSSSESSFSSSYHYCPHHQSAMAVLSKALQMAALVTDEDIKMTP